MKRNVFIKAVIGSVALAMIPTLANAKESKEKPKPYPLKVCIVSDETLGEMGKPKYLQYKSQTYGFCCKPCTKEFRDDPEKFRKKLEKLTQPKKK